MGNNRLSVEMLGSFEFTAYTRGTILAGAKYIMRPHMAVLMDGSRAVSMVVCTIRFPGLERNVVAKQARWSVVVGAKYIISSRVLSMTVRYTRQNPCPSKAESSIWHSVFVIRVYLRIFMAVLRDREGESMLPVKRAAGVSGL